jgi:hypothetical protein
MSVCSNASTTPAARAFQDPPPQARHALSSRIGEGHRVCSVDLDKVAISSMPPFPGAQKIVPLSATGPASIRGHAPSPLPTTRILMPPPASKVSFGISNCI